MSDYRKTFADLEPDEHENCPAFLGWYIQYLLISETQKISSVQDTLLCLREFCQFALHLATQPDQQPTREVKKLNIDSMKLETIAAVTHGQIERYLHFAETVLKNSSGTIKKKVVFLRKFFAYLEANSDELGIQLPCGNPLGAVKISSAPSSPSTVLTVSEVQQLLQGVAPSENMIRDRAIIALLVTSSLTISELVSLNRSDIFFSTSGRETSCVIVYRNNKKIRLPLSPPCVKALKAYIDTTAHLLPAYHNALFLSSQKHERMTPRGIQKRIRIAAKNAGLHKKITPQVLRNTAIYNYLQKLPAEAEVLLLHEIGFKTNYTLRRVSGGNLLEQASAESPLNNLEV